MFVVNMEHAISIHMHSVIFSVLVTIMNMLAAQVPWRPNTYMFAVSVTHAFKAKA